MLDKELSLLLKTNLKYFISYIHYKNFNNKYIFKDFHLEIIEYLEKYIYDLDNTKNLIINIPVRCGKSQLIVYFIEWMYFIKKQNNIIYTSYDNDLTLKYSKEVKDTLQYILNINLDNETKAKDEWKIKNGGEFIARSLKSGITGRGADFIIIDDPMKSNEFKSKTELENVIDIYNNTLKSRLNDKKKGRIILIMQRLCKGDLTDYLLNNEKDDWDLIKIPAIINNQSIFEEKLPLEYLLKEKEINNFNFCSQYMQEPIAVGGNIIKEVWFKNYDILPKLKNVYIVGDTAFKTSDANDYSVFQLWGKDNFSIDANYYLIDMIRGKWESPELLNNLLNFYEKNKKKYTISNLYIEDKASGIGLIQQIKRLSIPVKEVKKNKDKYLCLMDVLPRIASGYVYIPRIADWKLDFLNECIEFRQDMTHKHDDIVDCLSMALSQQSNITLQDFI